MNQKQIIESIIKRRHELGWSIYRTNRETGLTNYWIVEASFNPKLETLLTIADAMGLEFSMKVNERREKLGFEETN